MKINTQNMIATDLKFVQYVCPGSLATKKIAEITIQIKVCHTNPTGKKTKITKAMNINIFKTGFILCTAESRGMYPLIIPDIYNPPDEAVFTT